MTLDDALAAPGEGVLSHEGETCVVVISHDGWRIAFRLVAPSWEAEAVAFRPAQPMTAYEPLRRLPLGKLAATAREMAVAHRGPFQFTRPTKLHLSPFLQEGRGRGRSVADYAGLAVEYVMWRQRGGVSPARRFTDEMGGSIRVWHNRIDRARKLGLWQSVNGRALLTETGARWAGLEYDHPNPNLVGRPVSVPRKPPYNPR